MTLVTTTTNKHKRRHNVLRKTTVRSRGRPHLLRNHPRKHRRRNPLRQDKKVDKVAEALSRTAEKFDEETTAELELFEKSFREGWGEIEEGCDERHRLELIFRNVDGERSYKLDMNKLSAFGFEDLED